VESSATYWSLGNIHSPSLVCSEQKQLLILISSPR
jgi:hypothetical protein